ncbi:hypothetical protein BIFGAL_03884 [Bifidobacterium gallicum DSM 20093 = LMG 11596]|uniref:Uncharacterized protein n=1 Tax=Bifidobacterium gallicum DSM 20093 = LMG 11596 TaxID=561180 RepID=D1NVJ5_9BIFI|nr:hypothetical protein BIFGAL_03884 [Bifidobacterium gallicum DSM 20093 = LMG 11596]
MQFGTGKCSFPDRAGQQRCGLRAESVVFLTTLVRGGAVWDGKVRFC